MTASDENDKTKLKSSPKAGRQKEAGSVEEKQDIHFDRSEDQRTRVANDKNVNLSRNSKEGKKEAQKRQAAQTKARELERRLAAMTAKKNLEIDRKRSRLSGNSEDDKTRVDNRKPALGADNKTRIKSATRVDSDKTRIAPGRLQPSGDPIDKTVYKPTSSKAESAEDRDSGISDPTTLNDLAISSPTSGGFVSVDPAQYIEDGHELLKNRFVFEKVLGAGGMGVVYKAKDLLKVEAQDRDPYVAIKVLGDEFKSHPEAFIALQRESRKTQRIAHPNIVNVHDFDRDGETVFMTMEYLEGKPLDKLVSQYKSTGLPEQEAWKILEGICAALIYAHEQKIIHSDFKPGNIFVTSQGTAKVFDFGIARAVAKAEQLEDSIDDKTVFDAGNLGALTPAYASLEMLDGKTPDVRDDIYALGCIAYEMFTGNHPFNRLHANEAMQQKLKPKRISNISKRQWRVIERSLAFKRENRIENVAEFWQQISKKRGSGFILTSAAVLIFGLASAVAYQTFLAPVETTISKDEVRSEVEREFLIDQNKQTIRELLQSREFSNSWEKRLWEAFETLDGLEDIWLQEQRILVYQAYVEKINVLIVEEDFTRAREIQMNAYRYSLDTADLDSLAQKLDQAEALMEKRIAEEKQQQQLADEKRKAIAQKAKIQKEKNVAYDIAMSTVNKQLQCRNTISIRDIDIAVSKLRSLNAARYRKAEADIVEKLSVCISKIGRTFPERAEEFKKRAINIFPKNITVANIKIEPKDPCDQSLAGLGARGARAICRDPLKTGGDDLGKGPALVVIPSKGSVKTFAISKYEITLEDVNKFCIHTNKCEPLTSVSDKLPQTNLDSGTITQYLNWLSSMSKRKYRLPTKAEWVYASRADSTKLDSNRNCRLDSRGIKKGGVLIKATIGKQNGWGLVNYVGNTRELVVDRNGFAAVGGSFETAMQECVVTKSESHSGAADKLTGFRILREIDAKE